MGKIQSEISGTISTILGKEYLQKKNKFFRFYSDFFQLVEVSYTRIGDGIFAVTMYFGVLIPKVFELVWKAPHDKSMSSKLSAHDGIFICNINDIMTNFEGKPRVKYWDVALTDSCPEDLIHIIKEQVVPFISRFDSLESTNRLIDSINFPLKNSTDRPVKRLALKSIINLNDEFFSLASQLKSEGNHFGDVVDDLVRQKTYE